MVKEFKQRFNQYCRKAGWKHQELAKQLNVHNSTLSKWVNGGNPWPVDALTMVCELLELKEGEKQELFILAGLALPSPPSEQVKLQNKEPIIRVPLQRPSRASHFVGREAEIKHILENLQPGQIVTLVGPGGVGKTALITEAIWALAPHDQSPKQFPDGIVFCEFYRQPQAEQALEHIIHSFEEKRQSGSARDGARRALEGRQMLLVLDGVDNADNWGLVLGTRGSRCCVLITSTHSHDAEGILYLIEPMLPEAAGIVLNHWSQGKIRDQAIAEKICVLVGYLPLALRLAGEYMIHRRVSASDYLELLQKTELTALHLDERRHKSIPILLDISINPLNDQVRQTLAVIGLLALSPFNVTTIAAALASSNVNAFLYLGELVDYSLLKRVGNNYEVTHRLIHTYSRLKLNAPSETVERLVAHYIILIHQQQKRGTEGYIALDNERPHIMTLLAKCQDQQAWPLVKDLAWTIDEYLNLQGYWTQRVESLQAGLSAARALHDDHYEGNFLSKLGEVFRQQGRWDEAIRMCQESLHIFRAFKNAPGEAQALNRLGLVYFDQSQWDAAIQHFEESHRLYQSLKDRRGQAQIRNSLAEVYRKLRLWEQVIQQVNEALKIFQEIGDRLGESKALNNLGNIYADLSQWPKAIQMYEASLRLREALGDRRGQAITLNNLALLYNEQSQWDKAIEYYQRSLTICHDLGDRHGEGMALSNLGDVYADQGKWFNAIEKYQESLQIAQELRDRSGEASTLNNLGIIYYHQGLWTEAIRVYERSRQLKRDVQDRQGEGHTLNNLGRVLAQQGSVDEAIQLVEESLHIAQGLNYPQGEAWALESLALIHTKQKDWAKAIEKYEEALNIFHELGSQLWEGKVLVGIGTAQVNASQYAEAKSNFEAGLAILCKIGAHHDEGIALMNWAELYDKQGQQVEALQFWREALSKLNPESPEYGLVKQKLQR